MFGFFFLFVFFITGLFEKTVITEYDDLFTCLLLNFLLARRQAIITPLSQVLLSNKRRLMI